MERTPFQGVCDILTLDIDLTMTMIRPEPEKEQALGPAYHSPEAEQKKELELVTNTIHTAPVKEQTREKSRYAGSRNNLPPIYRISSPTSNFYYARRGF